MKIFQIALNTMTRSFRSSFMLAFMFGIPLLMAGMFALMSSGPSANAASQNTGGSAPQKTGGAIGTPQATESAGLAAAPAFQAARLAVADLDRGDPTLALGMAKMAPNVAPVKSLGEALVQALGEESLAALLQVSPAKDAEAALEAVRAGQADAALVIPADFSAAYVSSGTWTELELAANPERAAQAALIESILSTMADSFSGMKITMQVAFQQAQFQQASPETQTDLLSQITQGYQAAQPPDATRLVLDAPASTGSPSKDAAPKPADNPMSRVVAPILGGMTIFFAFFSGCTVAQGLLREGETGTLARLISTPTDLSTILGGKFVAVILTVLVQVGLLLAAGRLIFNIQWGALGSITMAALGIIACASTFGIFAISWCKSTRQAGMVVGGLMTVTGMLGMIGIFSGTGTTPWFSLLTPQGWSVRGLQLAMNGAETGEVALNLLALLGLSAIFFAAGRLRFQRRFE